EEALDRRGVRSEAQLSGSRRDLACQLDVAPQHPAVTLDERDHAHRHTVVTHVNVREKVVGARQLADGLYESGACRIRSCSEVRIRAVAEHAPIVDTLGLAELCRTDAVGHKASPVVIEVFVIKRRRLLRRNMVAWYDREMTIDQILPALAEQPRTSAPLPRICRELECTF